MQVKSKKNVDHISNIGKMFQIFGHFKMKLNAANCTFGVSSGKFFGLMVNNRRIEANLEKIKAMQDLKPPTSLKELQILIGVVVH